MPDVADTFERRMLNTPEAANYCGSTASTFEKFRLTGGGPIYSKLGRRVVYSVEDLNAWLTKNRRLSTPDTGERASSASSQTV